ncbi:class I SAM-dependent methyltransferase [Leptospira sp. 201903070]|uniref:Class I SAM-dependent methyltransferase n=1 Tax=Leptospira ainlahdjerensis TaxID=2810033 RepID=A0ABS2UG75_9LEPT|nr:class I SAM-dependent methyltransferase [Leptospira ainlahdjerensis]MBM9579361.1 class I SAM-dependent methyltransferase [Leptospira ainlahdjerensis]
MKPKTPKKKTKNTTRTVKTKTPSKKIPVQSIPAPEMESFYAKMFARFYDRFMDRIERTVLHRKRKYLIHPLQGKILEIGSGTGINFPIYSSKADVIAIEPSISMMEKAKERIRSFQSSSDSSRHARIKMEVIGLGNPELESLIPPKSMDAILFTLVLCTVPDPVYAIQFAKSRLKRGGKILILEHVQATSKAGQILQNLLNPFWNRFAQGCNLNRDPASILKAAGFKPIEEFRFKKTLPFYQAIYELK